MIIKTQGRKLERLILSLKWLSMLQTCSKLVLVMSWLRNPDCISTMKKRVFTGCSNYVIRKNHVTRPIFWDFRITIPRKICNSFFHHLTKENTILDYKIRKLQGHFWRKKNRKHEKSNMMEKVNLYFFSSLFSEIKLNSLKKSYKVSPPSLVVYYELNFD